MKTNCLSCPCLNNDADYGYTCNLGYKVKDNLFVPTSENCNLISIKFKNEEGEEEEFTPEEEN